MKKVFMVAEKPMLANSIADILSGGKKTTKKATSAVHEWQGQFLNETMKFKMTSVFGHVMSLDFPGHFNAWDKVDPVELFTCPTEKKEANPKVKMVSFLAYEAKFFDYLVLWLDCDKEGENICFEVIDAVQGSIRNVTSNRVTYRAKFSAITDKDIRYAFNNLSHPNEKEAKSVDARQELDLRIGCAFTRFQTKFFQGKYGDLDASLISYGPCQTPTLGFCVQRHDEIQTFKPESYWYIQVLIGGQPEVKLSWSRNRIFDKDVAMMFLSRVTKDSKEARVLKVSSKTQTKSRPCALNTVELLKACSAGLGLSPHTAMQIAEKLYTQGYVSYPRTETTSYPDSFDIRSVVKTLGNVSDYTEASQKILGNFHAPKKGENKGDHPPLTPTASATKGEFDSDTWKVYDYICRHFLATVSRDMTFKVTTYEFKVGDEYFSTCSNLLVDAGFTDIMTWQAFSKNELSTEFKEGDIVKVNDVKLLEGLTEAPDYLSESELIGLMEKHGIGTDASIPVHINNICQRNYVTIANKRKLIPSTLGIVLVHGYQKIDPELVLPTMRAAVEKQLELIAHGAASFKPVLEHALNIFRLKYKYFVRAITNMDTLFEVSFTPLAASGKAYSRCGKCRRYMKYIQTKPARLYCPQCDETYSLPRGGLVRVYKELKCPLDDFELIAWSGGTKAKSYSLCPYCYNYPPFEDMPKMSGCNNCRHPTCPHSLDNLGVSNCDECTRGILVLDCTASPKNWKLGCNVCDVIINCFEDAMKVTVEANCCEQCEAQLVLVVYKAEKTPFKDEETEKTGCIFCSSEFQPLVEKHKAVQNRQLFMTNRRTRGGGVRGRGKSNRGKPKVIKDKMAKLDAYFV